jgi:small subunit ribosomal protein S4
MKYTGPKARKVRRLGMNLYGSDKYDRALQRKPFGPGKNAKTRQGRDSEYAKQLKEKQKARDMYGLSEHQFRRLYNEALKAKGKTGDTLRVLLEQRFDNVLYRSGFALTRFQARQFAGHGLFMVDGKRVTIPSMRMRPGQVVTVRSKVKDSPVFGTIMEKNEKYAAPKWLKVDPNALRTEIVAVPAGDDGEQGVDMRLVVEFYSRN